MAAAPEESQTDPQAGGLIEEIIKMSDFSFERLPMLDIIGDRLATLLSAALPDLTGVICESSFDLLDYVPMAQVLEGIPSPTLLGIATAPTLEGPVLLVMDAPLVLTTVELALGGLAKGAAAEVAGFTAIERGFGGQLADVILAELSQAYSVVGDVQLELERVDSDIEAAAITQPSSLCVRMQLAIQISGRLGLLLVIVPYDALEPIRSQLGRIHFGEPSDEGNPWRELLSMQIESATVELEAIFSEVSTPIQNIMDWEPGDTIPLWVDDGHETTVVCAKTPMFQATAGKRNNGNIAIKITEMIEVEEESENGRDDN